MSGGTRVRVEGCEKRGWARARGMGRDGRGRGRHAGEGMTHTPSTLPYPSPPIAALFLCRCGAHVHRLTRAVASHTSCAGAVLTQAQAQRRHPHRPPGGEWGLLFYWNAVLIAALLTSRLCFTCDLSPRPPPSLSPLPPFTAQAPVLILLLIQSQGLLPLPLPPPRCLCSSSSC